jgi:hypothetical protein
MIKLVIDKAKAQRLKQRFLVKFAPGYVAKVNREYAAWHSRQVARTIGSNHKPIVEALALGKNQPKVGNDEDHPWSTGAIKEAQKLRAQAKDLLAQADELDNEFLVPISVV